VCQCKTHSCYVNSPSQFPDIDGCFEDGAVGLEKRDYKYRMSRKGSCWTGGDGRVYQEQSRIERKTKHSVFTCLTGSLKTDHPSLLCFVSFRQAGTSTASGNIPAVLYEVWRSRGIAGWVSWNCLPQSISQ